MSSSNSKSDEYHPPLYRQNGYSEKVGYFRYAHFEINCDEFFFRDFLETYKHAITLGVCVKRMRDESNHEPCNVAFKAKKIAIKFHSYYTVLGFSFPPHLFQKVIYSMNYTPTQCSPNAVHVGFFNLCKFFYLGFN